MRNTLGESLRKLHRIRVRKKRMAAVVALLSLLVSMDVFLALRQPGLTLAGDADCGIMEHTHGDDCGAQLCICDLEGATHVHDAACYETRWVDAGEERQLMCDETETPHTHNGSCYETVITPKTETVLLCENQDADHSHGDACYKTEETDGPIETVLKCSLVYEPHQHTDACFMTQTIDAHEEQTLICGLSEGIHTHSEACYKQEMTCGYEEHVHSIDCYADKTADTETMLDWQRMFADYPYTGDLRRDLVGIAKTQVGYCESERNFEIGQDGISRGYTRYGAWYGAPYSNWSAMFVSFCLHYAGADPAQAPGNTGAASMAQLWNNLGKYVSSGDYVPQTGDLVFFGNNTVGIVAEVYNATVYVICGDVNDMVWGDALSVADGSIVGWGITEGSLAVDGESGEPEEPEKVEELEELEKIEETGQSKEENSLITYPAEIDREVLLDIADGPAIFLIEGSPPVSEGIVRYSFRNTRAATELLPYLNAYGGGYFFTLLDEHNEELPKDENGNYIATANSGYKITLTFTSPEGFLPGTYQYQIPNGLMVDGGEGSFVLLDGTNVGSWVVSDTGLITLYFNEHMNSRTDIAISATLGIHFPEQEEPIDFDGQISVKVEKPPQQNKPTLLNKWGSQSTKDTSKIAWQIEIIGQADSRIPGNILSDKVFDGEWSQEHRYTESDMAAGLSFGASDPNGGWHTWQVFIDDPRLEWDETGWSYKIPETVTCPHCGELVLGNEGWIYYVGYTSTPDTLNISGSVGYENIASIDGQTKWGWANFVHGEINATINKNGSFVSDAAGGSFLWEVQATIPGRKEGEKAEYSWFFMDEMKLLDENGGTVDYVDNDIHLAEVTTVYNGATIRVPRLQDATDGDMFAWDNSWTSEEGGSHTRTINLLARCHCTPESCYWGNCGEYWYQDDNGQWLSTTEFCQCWTETQNMTFTFVYKTTDISLIDNYGVLGYKVNNFAQLFYMPDGKNSTRVDFANATVAIPNLFKKELDHSFDGYTANYKVTVNEAKINLTNGSPLTIHDVMSDTLAYISGSLVITAEDVGGNIRTLQQGTDFTVTYDGTGDQKDENGNSVHILDIVILHPQPVKYLLDYDATLILPEHVTSGIKYTNSANITLWGEEISDTSTEKVYADFNIAAKSYKVELFKTAVDTQEPLGGATFGLYNEEGGLITTEVTDFHGQLFFQTNIVKGIILREHQLYYMQEIQPPPGYALDETKHWFCFCDEVSDSCEVCNAIIGDKNAVRIPFEQVGKVAVTNELMKYDLPATGGMGTYPVILVGVILIIIPLVYELIRRRKQERRGVG